MTNVLDGLIDKIDDLSLRAALRKEVELLRGNKRFGLVFERHLPEVAKLRDHPVRLGATVQRRAQGVQPSGLVTKLSNGKATAEWEGGNVEDVAVDELVVVARLGDPMYPGLKSVGRIERGGDKPFHAVINAENYHALETLRFTHAGQVDAIYIDPPYNLGGDLTYNDKRVAKDDAFRHSKWLSFMNRRLRLARDLLTPTGAIIVAIDDTEQAHLRMLMDEVFGEQNFIACVVWQGGRKNDSRYVSVGHDYMLLYAKSEALLRKAEIRWRERKPGVDAALERAAAIWEETGGDHATAQKKWRAWLREFKKTGTPTDAVTRYSTLDDDGRPIRTDGNISWPGGGGPRYDVLHPVTEKPCAVPSRGWMYADPRRMQEEIDAGRIYFGPDHTTQPGGKVWLEKMDQQVAESVFVRDRNAAATALTDLLGEKRFTFPKDTDVLARWIGMVTQERRDAVVLDFFAGSGSTAQAVMELNAADDGRRQCILVTNNEVEEKQAKKLHKKSLLPGDPEWEQWGIFEYVAKPRLETLVTGTRPDRSSYSDGLSENVEFLKLTYLEPDRVARGRSFPDIAPLLWMSAGAVGPRIEAVADDYACPDSATYAVLFDPAYVRDLADGLETREEVTRVFIVTDSPAVYQQAATELPAHVDAGRLYEDYLHNFENTGDEL